jgi:hypothetical protein
LMGTGTIAGLNVASGAVVAPGNSIGTLNVVGNVNFGPSSVYQVRPMQRDSPTSSSLAAPRHCLGAPCRSWPRTATMPAKHVIPS